MAAMYFSPEDGTRVEEATEALRTAARGLGGHVGVEDTKEIYEGSGPIEAFATPQDLDNLKKLAGDQRLPVKSERLDYEPLESEDVNRIFGDDYFDEPNSRKTLGHKQRTTRKEADHGLTYPKDCEHPAIGRS